MRISDWSSDVCSSDLCCDNMNGNGAKLGAAAALFARRFDAGLADWIAGEVAFPDTMVDSITPAADAAHLARARGLLGVDDAAAEQREGFTQWVVEHFAQIGRAACR